MAAASAWAAEDAASSDAEPLVLEPSSGWMVGFTGDSCVLAREFGSDAHAVTLRFIKDAPGDGSMHKRSANHLRWLLNLPLRGEAPRGPDGPGIMGLE